MPFLTSLIKDVLYTMHTFQKSRIHEMTYLTLFCQNKSKKIAEIWNLYNDYKLCPERRKCHLRHPRLKEITGGMPPDPPSTPGPDGPRYQVILWASPPLVKSLDPHLYNSQIPYIRLVIRKLTISTQLICSSEKNLYNYIRTC
jgi:hypothetical protein